MKEKGKKTKTERNKWLAQAVVKVWELNVFVVLCFVQLICKASLIFKSNLELALSIILKERELYESKHVVVECRCLKIWDLLSFLIGSSLLGFQITTSFANAARTTVNTNKFIY